MKKRHLLLLSMVPLSLSSCGDSGYAGTYSFQLGKNSGAHATATMTLGKEDYVEENKTLGKKMSFFGIMKMGPSESSSQSSQPVQSSSGEEEVSVPDNLTDMLSNGVELDGYYNVGEATENGRSHLILNFSLSSLLPEGSPAVSLPSEIIEQIVYSEIDAKKVYLQIPVSFTDLALQLYWYGTDMMWLSVLDDVNAAPVDTSTDTETPEGEKPEPEVHPVGTKPTQVDIDKINETYPAWHNGERFRGFYTISLSLTRQ